MLVQALPCGQHIAEAPSLKAMQVSPDEQQKSEGRPCPQEVYPDRPAQVVESRLKRSLD